ncbi:MAG TPA: MEDS domain-containing protein [Gemmatimonadaceae bacterium]|jgi:hypothetical protein|nr:MEDS domain-containing protein [Gemmatimonadaceae bacterium]
MHLHLINVIQDADRPAGPTPAATVGHDVAFYRTDEYLTRAVVDFLCSGVKAGQPLIVIATEPHRDAFMVALRARGLDPDELMSGREAVWLDARETLNAFMEGGIPDRDLFMATVGSVFERILRKRHYLIVRGYGEMVDLLAKDGNVEGAVLLEALWNELAEKYSYSLLCGYSLNNFLHETGAQGLRRICEHHSHTLPVEQINEASA